MSLRAMRPLRHPHRSARHCMDIDVDLRDCDSVELPSDDGQTMVELHPTISSRSNKHCVVLNKMQGPLIGVLAIQGAFEEHQKCLEAIGCRSVQVSASKSMRELTHRDVSPDSTPTRRFVHPKIWKVLMESCYQVENLQQWVSLVQHPRPMEKPCGRLFRPLVKPNPLGGRARA